MNNYLGIDLGTSGLKILLCNSLGNILYETSRQYDVSYPQEGWSEQDPQLWITAVVDALKEITAKFDACDIKGVSFGGQMHGLVILDKDDNVIRPCILWNDGRTEKQTKYLNTVIGKERLSKLTGNIAFAGFTAPKLLWLKENEPENFNKISKIMLPKDYLVYKFTKVFATDFSDASGTLLLDVKNKRWSKEMCEICGIDVSKLPTLYESYQKVSNISNEFAILCGLEESTVVVAGGGDNAVAAIGTSTIDEGDCNISLGTSGTVFFPSNEFVVDDKNALHSFCHSNGKWHLMGCILSAASCRKWWIEDIISSNEYGLDEEELSKTDSGSVIFLPYLMGERSPHNDTNIRGAFLGLSSTTTRAQMSRAILEGVTFAIKDCMEVAKANGVKPKRTSLCGGGAKSATWKQMVADIMEIPVTITETEQGPSYGASIIAMVGSGFYPTVEKAVETIVKTKNVMLPNSNNFEYYRKKYNVFKQLYPILSGLIIN